LPQFHHNHPGYAWPVWINIDKRWYTICGIWYLHLGVSAFADSNRSANIERVAHSVHASYCVCAEHKKKHKKSVLKCAADIKEEKYVPFLDL
jgi:hypothetical protein